MWAPQGYADGRRRNAAQVRLQLAFCLSGMSWTRFRPSGPPGSDWILLIFSFHFLTVMYHLSSYKGLPIGQDMGQERGRGRTRQERSGPRNDGTGQEQDGAHDRVQDRGQHRGQERTEDRTGQLRGQDRVHAGDRTEDITVQDRGGQDTGPDREHVRTGHDRTVDRTWDMTEQDKGQDMRQGKTMTTYTKQAIVYHYDSMIKYKVFYHMILHKCESIVL